MVKLVRTIVSAHGAVATIRPGNVAATGTAAAKRPTAIDLRQDWVEHLDLTQRTVALRHGEGERLPAPRHTAA